MKISIIVAMAQNNVIGFQNKMPWHLPAELQYFKQVTMGKPIIMGRKTYESIGKPLPGRKNIVITSQQDYQADGISIVHSLDAALQQVQDAPEVMIIGGAKIYEQAVHLANRMYVTVIDHCFEGDTFFPHWDTHLWQVIAQMTYAADEKNPYAYKTMTLERTA